MADKLHFSLVSPEREPLESLTAEALISDIAATEAKLDGLEGDAALAVTQDLDGLRALQAGL